MRSCVLDPASLTRLAPGTSCSPRCGPTLPLQHRRSRTTTPLHQQRLASCATDTSGPRAALERLYLWDEGALGREPQPHSSAGPTASQPGSALGGEPQPSNPAVEASPLREAPSQGWEQPQPASSEDDLMESWAASSTVFRVSLQDKPTLKEEKASDFYANVGDAIRTLRDDVPRLFEKDLTYDIYREDITFKDPLNTFAGIKNYATIFWSLRFHGKLFFSRLFVDIKRIWQPPTDDQVIKMRWTVRGIPRVPWEAQGLFDGISTYKLDRHGRIYEHSVDNVLLRDPPFAGLMAPRLMGINLLPMGQEEEPQPIPGLYPMLASAWQGLSWCRLYVALCATVLLNSSLCAAAGEKASAPAAEGQ